MAKPVTKINMTKKQLCEAVQTYLNDHVFKEAITVGKVEPCYGDETDAIVIVTLIDDQPAPVDG